MRKDEKMNTMKKFGNHMVAGVVLFGLFAAPAFALTTTMDNSHRSVSGAGFVLMVSLQRNAS